jgi:hypothetical protein
MSYLEWSTTAATNATADANINWAEGQAPSTVNNSARAEMAAMASFFEAIGGANTTGGTGSAYTLTLADVPTAYTTSMLFLVKFNTASTSATATINVNSLGAKTLKLWDGTALPYASYIPANAYGLIKYDGTDMRVFLPGRAVQQDVAASWTPTITFETAGDLSTAYSAQTGTYVRIGVMLYVRFIVTFTPTFSTSSGSLLITGLPVDPISTFEGGSLSHIDSDFTWPSGRSFLTLRTNTAVASLRLAAHGTGATTTFIGASNMVSGNEHSIAGTITYGV